MKNSIKKITCIFLALSVVIALVACGDKAGATQDVIFKNKSSVELGTPDVKLNPQDVYAKLTYTPQMFYGIYRIQGGKSAEEKFCQESTYITYNNGEKEMSLTKLPFEIRAGRNTLNYTITNVTEYNWIELYMGYKVEGNKKPTLYNVVCSYTIEGNKLILKPLKNFSTDTEKKEITYEFSDAVWEYEFKFNGRNLTLSSGEDSVELASCLDAHGEKDHYYVNNYLSEGSAHLDNIDAIDMLYDDKGNTYVYFKTADKTTSYDAIVKYETNGLLTFTVPFEDNPVAKTYQFVAFFCDYDGIVLTNGVDTYYFNDSSSDRNRRDVQKYISTDMTGMVPELSDEDLKMVSEKKDSLMDDLAKAFEDAGIKVTVDIINGELRMDSSVLFGGDSAVLSAEGKAFLDKFLTAYTSIVFSEKYNGFVAKTLVEGHTAPLANSTYESGLPLSTERADVVKSYCCSAETSADTSRLADTLEAVGMSNSKPVIDAYGNVDIEASRRVSFRFIINIQ